MAKKTLFINRHDEFTEGIPQTGPALISIHTVRRPCLLRRSSGKSGIQVESEDIPEQPVTPLKTAILQAHQGMAQLTSGKAATMQEIANKLKMDRSYLARTPDYRFQKWRLENACPEPVLRYASNAAAFALVSKAI